MTDRITATFGLTINLGNYESARIDCQYETDVREGETIEEAYDRAWSIVDEQIAAKTEENK